MPTFQPGYLATVGIGTVSSETDYTGIGDNAEFKQAVAKLNTTTFGNVYEQFIPGIANYTFKFDVSVSVAEFATLQAIFGVPSQSVIFKPAGAGSGYPVFQVGGFIAGIDTKSATAAKVTASIEFCCSGALTFTHA